MIATLSDRKRYLQANREVFKSTTIWELNEIQFRLE